MSYIQRMINTVTLNADIAYYNNYLIEMAVHDVQSGNEAIFTMSRISVGKNVKFRLLQSQVRPVISASGIFEGVNLYGAKRQHKNSGEVKRLSVPQAQLCPSYSTHQLFLMYQVQVPEFNRYRIEVDAATHEAAMNSVMLYKGQFQTGYRPSMIQVGARDFTERSPVVILL